MSSKGSSFEREICVLLSKWWTDGKDEDVFWRTAGSGARATMRAKVGKKTYGNNGDIKSENPIGEPLTKLCCIELKRGYSKDTVFNIIDKPKKAKKQMYEDFFEQAKRESSESGIPYWMLITRRDRRESIVYIPRDFYQALQGRCSLKAYCYLSCYGWKVYMIPLVRFLLQVQPMQIKCLYDQLQNKI